jgi:hypothetical protein
VGKNISLSPSNMEKYVVQFKKYVQAYAKEIARPYTSTKEFKLVKDVKESS